jgi:hypothetical protein
MTATTTPGWLTYGKAILVRSFDEVAETMHIEGVGFGIYVEPADEHGIFWLVTLWRHGVEWQEYFSRNELMQAFGELSESLPCQHQGYVYPRADGGAIGKFLRRGSVLRIPGPPLGRDGAWGVSIEIDPEVRRKTVKLLRRR